MYTLEDYEQAKKELKGWMERWNDYTGNNPDKYQADIRAARNRLAEIEADLKRRGVLELSEREKLEKRLDEAFPNAQSKEIVKFEGKQYRRRFLAADKTRSGAVVRWDKYWEEIK